MTEEIATTDPVLAAGSSLMLGKIGSIGKKILAAYAIGNSLYIVGKRAYKWVDSNFTYEVRVGSKDDLFVHLHRWVLEHLEERHQRSILTMSSFRRNDDEISPDDSMQSRHAVNLTHFYDGERKVRTQLEGHRIEISMEKHSNNTARRQERSYDTENKLILSARTIDGKRSIVRFLERIADENLNKDIATPRFYYADRWGSWSRLKDVPLRSPGSIILKNGQMERVIADVESFISEEDAYVRLGAPYHRGYLFTGPPGTGKTSIARAIASHFDSDIYTIALSDLSKDANLTGLIASIDAKAILLLEDIDVMHAATDRSDSKGGVTLSGLLNALDGVGTPHGLITIMTSNHPEVLDEALMRPGRVDLHEKFTAVDNEQLRKLFTSFYEGCPDLPPVGREIMPAEVTETFKRNIHNPIAAREALFSGERLLVPTSPKASPHGQA